MTAPYVDKLKRRFRVTHPFHPLSQHQFELLGYRKSWGRAFIDFRKKNGEMGAIPLGWTDAEQADPFLEISQGRSAFRVSELLRLVELIAAGKGAEGDGC